MKNTSHKNLQKIVAPFVGLLVCASPIIGASKFETASVERTSNAIVLANNRPLLTGTWRFDSVSGPGYVLLKLFPDGTTTRVVYFLGKEIGGFSGTYSDNGDGRLILKFTKPYATNEIFSFTLTAEILTLKDAEGNSEDYVRTN